MSTETIDHHTLARLVGLGIERFDVDAVKFDPATVTTYSRPDASQTLKRTHEAAAHDQWFRAEVGQGIAQADDPATAWVSQDDAQLHCSLRQIGVLSTPIRRLGAIFMESLSPCTAAMTQDEKDYFKLLGSRVARLRKDQGLTQVQLAEALAMSRPRHAPNAGRCRRWRGTWSVSARYPRRIISSRSR